MAKLKVKDQNRAPDLLSDLRYLRDAELEIGIFGGKEGSKTLMIASVHEFGTTIKAKNAAALTIPLNDEAAGKKAGEFDNLFVLNADDDEDGILAMERADGSIRPMYVLTKSVTIPERSYIRGTFDSEYKKIQSRIEKAFQSVLAGRMRPKKALGIIGEWLVTLVRKYMVELDSPPNSDVTKKTKKGQDNPLIDRGRLRGSITWRIR